MISMLSWLSSTTRIRPPSSFVRSVISLRSGNTLQWRRSARAHDQPDLHVECHHSRRSRRRAIDAHMAEKVFWLNGWSQARTGNGHAHCSRARRRHHIHFEGAAMYYDDESGAVTFVAGLLLGAVLGASLALLAAPQSGKKTRRRILRAVSSARD